MTTEMLSTAQVAARLHEMLIAGNPFAIYEELFAENAVALEPKAAGMERVEGRAAIAAKSKGMIEAMKEMKSRVVNPTYVRSGNHIAINIKLDAVLKDDSALQLDEMVLYTVENGKIVSEQIFY